MKYTKKKMSAKGYKKNAMTKMAGWMAKKGMKTGDRMRGKW